MVENREGAKKEDNYTYMVQGENDGINERTKMMHGKVSDNPELAKERLNQ